MWQDQVRNVLHVTLSNMTGTHRTILCGPRLKHTISEFRSSFRQECSIYFWFKEKQISEMLHRLTCHIRYTYIPITHAIHTYTCTNRAREGYNHQETKTIIPDLLSYYSLPYIEPAIHYSLSYIEPAIHADREWSNQRRCNSYIFRHNLVPRRPDAKKKRREKVRI